MSGVRAVGLLMVQKKLAEQLRKDVAMDFFRRIEKEKRGKKEKKEMSPQTFSELFSVDIFVTCQIRHIISSSLC